MNGNRCVLLAVLGLSILMIVPETGRAQRDEISPPGGLFKKESFRLNGQGPVDALAFSANGKHLVAAHGRDVVLWDLASQKEVQRWTIPANWNFLIDVRLSPDGKLVAAAGSSGGSRPRAKPGPAGVIWEVRTGKIRHGLGGTEEACRSLVFAPNGRTVAFGGTCLRLHDAGTGRRLWQVGSEKFVRGPLREADAGTTVQTAFAPDSRLLASLSGQNVLNLWSSAGKHLVRVPGQQARVAPYAGLAFSPDGKRLAWRQPDRTINLLDPRNGKTMRTITPRDVKSSTDGDGRLMGYHVGYSPDGALLVSGEFGSRRGQLVFFEVATGKELQRIEEGAHRIARVAFSPDGKLLALGRLYGTVHFWERSSPGEAVPRLPIPKR